MPRAFRRTMAEAVDWCSYHSCKIEFGLFRRRCNVRLSMRVGQGSLVCTATTLPIAVEKLEREFYSLEEVRRNIAGTLAGLKGAA